MIQCKELGTGSLQAGYSIFLTLATHQLGDLGHASKLWISYLHQEDIGDMIFTILLIYYLVLSRTLRAYNANFLPNGKTFD